MATSSQGYGQAVPGGAAGTESVTAQATGGSDTDRSCAIARQFVEDGVNKHDTARIMSLLSPDFTITHNVRTPTGHGPETFWEACRPFFDALPDLHLTIDELVAQGDRVAGRFTVSGTNQGSWQGRPATNRSVSFKAVNLMTVRQNQIVRMDILDDYYGLLQQLGVVPETEEEVSRH